MGRHRGHSGNSRGGGGEAWFGRNGSAKLGGGRCVYKRESGKKSKGATTLAVSFGTLDGGNAWGGIGGTRGTQAEVVGRPGSKGMEVHVKSK